MVAIIGGTGIGERLMTMGGKPASFDGYPASRLSEKVFSFARHGAGHKTPPHAVDYRGIARALSKNNFRYCLATAAVGSLREDLLPGTLLVLNDFIDLTGRNITMHETNVQHIDFSQPFSEDARRALLSAAQEQNVTVLDSGVYIGASGPRYETPAEVRLYRQFGGDVVGMTASSEAIVMREIGISYACLAIVTNLGTGLSSASLSHSEVVDVMKERGDVVTRLLLRAAEHLANE